MKQLFQSVWWWTRVGVIAVVGVYVLVLLARNADQSANIWYWPGRPAETTSIIALALVSFIAGGLICSIGWALFSAWVNYRRTREIRRKRLIQQHRAELQRKAGMLRVKPPVQPTVRLPKPITPPPSVDETPEPIVEPLMPATVVEPVRAPTIVSAPVTAAPVVVPIVESGPITVEAHRATPFASQPITAPAAAIAPDSISDPKTDHPEVIDPPEPSR